MVIKCPKCNHYVSDTTAVCPHCGAVLKEGVPVQTQEPASVIQEKKPKTQEEEITQPVNPPVEKPVNEPKVEATVKVVPAMEDMPVTEYKPTTAASAPAAPPPVAYQQAEKKKTTFIAVIVVLIVLLCGVGGWLAYQEIAQTDNNTSENIEYAPLTVIFCGKIGIYPITMELEYEIDSSGGGTGKISGSYYYDKQGSDKRLTLSGFVNKDEKTELYEIDETGRQMGHFIGQQTPGVYEGEFVDVKGKSMHFKLEDNTWEILNSRDDQE